MAFLAIVSKEFKILRRLLLLKDIGFRGRQGVKSFFLLAG
jgi:hypothetical protein